MGWTVVPNLDELRDQLNTRFPNRDRSSDGSIGDTSHAAGSSSHNPDKTGAPEFRDGDGKDEVRARDFDSDLRDSAGVTAEKVVQHIVEMARSGRLPNVRYVIFNRRIWNRSGNFATQKYTGKNPHDKHFHVNSEFNQTADEARGVNWGLNELGGSVPAPGPQTNPAAVIRHVQAFLVRVFPIYRLYVPYLPGKMLGIDGVAGPQTASWVKEFQRRTSIPNTGVIDEVTLKKMRQYGYQY